MSSRERILGALRGRAARPFPDVTPPTGYRSVVPVDDPSPGGLRRRFLDEARRAGCVVHEASSAAAGVAVVLGLIGGDAAISSWELGHIPLPGLAAALDGAGVVRVGQDAAVRVGLTGADAALAATGAAVGAAPRPARSRTQLATWRRVGKSRRRRFSSRSRS